MHGLGLYFQELKNPFSKDMPPVLVARSDAYPHLATVGKGLDVDSRLLSAAGEFQERIAMHEVAAEHVIVFESRADQLSPFVFHPQSDVSGLAVEWVEVTARSTGAKFFVHRPIRNSRIAKYFSHTSNGCAVGQSETQSLQNAFGEIYERHNFLSAWRFNNLEIRKEKYKPSVAKVLKSVGWSIQVYWIKSEINAGTVCALLRNESDHRFICGSGILGLCYGQGESASELAVAEALQALEVFLIGGIREPNLDYYLSRRDGADKLESFFCRKRGQSDELATGEEYYYANTLPGEFSSYTEAFVVQALPLRLSQNGQPVGKRPIPIG